MDSNQFSKQFKIPSIILFVVLLVLNLINPPNSDARGIVMTLAATCTVVYFVYIYFYLGQNKRYKFSRTDMLLSASNLFMFFVIYEGNFYRAGGAIFMVLATSVFASMFIEYSDEDKKD